MSTHVKPEQAALVLDAIDTLDLVAAGEPIADVDLAGMIEYVHMLEAFVMLYRARLGDPCEVSAIRAVARVNARQAL